MVGLLQLKLPTSTPAGFLINGLIMNLLQYIFPQAENLVFQFPKSRGRIFLCVSPTFASPIEKPATSALRRICRRAFFYFPEKFSPPQTGEFFESQKEEHFHFSKNSPGETGTLFCLKKEFEHCENGRKEIRTSGLYT